MRRFLLEERRSRVAGLRGDAGQRRRLRQRQGHRGAGLGGQAVRAAGPAAPGEGVPRDGAGHRGAALHAPRAPAAGDRGRRARRAVGHGHVRGPGRGAGGRRVQRARGATASDRAGARRLGHRCAATSPIREVNRELGLELEAADDVTTIGGLCTKLAGGIPNRDARLAANDGIVLVVLDATPADGAPRPRDSAARRWSQSPIPSDGRRDAAIRSDRPLDQGWQGSTILPGQN